MQGICALKLFIPKTSLLAAASVLGERIGDVGKAIQAKWKQDEEERAFKATIKPRLFAAAAKLRDSLVECVAQIETKVAPKSSSLATV